jgi:hypothetical protein
MRSTLRNVILCCTLIVTSATLRADVPPPEVPPSQLTIQQILWVLTLVIH